MVIVMSSGNRDNPGLTLLMAVIAGLLIGLASFVIKMVVSGLSLTQLFPIIVLANPLSYLAGFLGILGFVLFQKSLQIGRITMITPIMNGISIIVPILLAVLFLSESLPALKLAGIVLIVVGIAGLK